MAFNLISSKLTGNPGTSGWAQVHEFAPVEPEKLESRGRLYAVVATGRHEEGVDAVSAGRELLARLHEEYFGGEEGPAFAILQNAVKKVSDEFGQSWGEVEIAAVALVGDVVYSVVGGGAQVAIFRNGMLAKILESSKEEVISASGYPQAEDLLILGTKAFFDSLAAGVLKAALQGKDPAAAVEQLAPVVHSKQDTGNLGATIIVFKETEGTQVTPVQEISEEKAPLQEKPQLSSYLRKGLSFIQNFVSKKLPERRIYVRPGETEEEVPQKRKTMVTVGAILVVLLVVSIGFGIRAKNVREQKGRYEERLTQAEHEFDESLSLASLNPERARELFANSKGAAEALLGEGIKDKRLDLLSQKLSENQGNILGEYKVDPELFVDLSLQVSGFEGQEVASSGKTIFVLDKKGKRIISVDFGTKKTQVASGPDQIGEAQSLAAYEDRVFILTPDGVSEVGKTKSQVIDKSWDGEVLVYAYAGNLYLIDKVGSTIWRYPGTGEAFASKQNWLAPGTKVDLSQVKSVTIDGTIFLLSSSGKLSKFSLGNPTGFTPQGVFPELSTPDAIYTNEELKYAYVLERSEKRIVVLEKDGKYKAQYTSDKIGEAQDLAVSEKEGKIIILTGSKLLSIKIGHL